MTFMSEGGFRTGPGPMYVGRSSSKISSFFSRGMEADRNVKVVGGDVAVL